MLPVESERIWEFAIPTADGAFLARYSTTGLCGLRFPDDTRALPDPVENAPVEIIAWHRITTAALAAALKGNGFAKLPPLDLREGTEFQRSVWNTMLQIPAGDTASYGEIAQRIGKPKALRAVGGACGANPIPVLVPCHRVLAANSRIGGFSSGLDWKRKLLAREGIVPREKQPRQKMLVRTS
jgi:O-6-methylguanine DNA methyltransferase